MTSGGENREKRCRDFVRRKNRGISAILGGRRLKSPDRFCLIERQRVIDWKRIDFMLELAEA